MKTREEIIENMCLTYNHAYVLPTLDVDYDDPLSCALTQEDKEFIWRHMAQIFDNDVAPYMEFKE